MTSGGHRSPHGVERENQGYVLGFARVDTICDSSDMPECSKGKGPLLGDFL
ncbi:hypothetical protein Sjap_011708 [Stephania japonica]|uniref:Uncharacterized protein n=1 Tax=Stephania japonica TaxID=461633 RepID=A0AAP0JDM8_9MAGN